jgi:TolB-like protein/Tfp pilus assembly protein PilF
MNFFTELKRRNVYKVAVAYAVVGWLLIQAASILFPTFDAPAWVMKVVVVIIAIGFPIALILAWAFEMTPEGIKRTDQAGESRRKRSGNRAWIYVVIVGLLLSTGLFFLGRYTVRISSGSVWSEVYRAGDGPLAKSIAVLPFENRSEDKANAYFADGIQDEILTRLAKIADLKVISRTSTQRYKSSGENIREIAKQLRVEHVLEGSVQKAGDQVRVTVQLIRAATDSHLWAETYDRRLTDIFAVESEVAETIARSLQARLTPREQQAVSSKPTGDAAAYEAYLRGLARWNKFSFLPEDSEMVIRDFSRAVELDPKFTLGWAYLSVVRSNTYREFDPTPQLATEAKEALERAQSLQPDLGEVHFADGMYFYKVLRDYLKAIDGFQKAHQSLPNRPMPIEYLSYVKRRQGKWREALQLHAESLELDPRNPNILAEAGLTHRALRRFDEAHALVDRAREIDPENGQLLAQKAEIFFAQGDSEAAGRLLKTIPVEGKDPVVAMAYVRFWIFMRQYPPAIHALKRVVEDRTTLPPTMGAVAANYRAELAVTEALAGNPEAHAALERSRDELKSTRAHGGDLNWTATILALISGMLKDKATVDDMAEQLRERIESDALAGPGLETAIALARAHLGETDAALESVKRLLQTPGEGSLTPALLRADPLWDPIRGDPRFKALVEGPQPKTVYQ